MRYCGAVSGISRGWKGVLALIAAADVIKYLWTAAFDPLPRPCWNCIPQCLRYTIRCLRLLPSARTLCMFCPVTTPDADDVLVHAAAPCPAVRFTTGLDCYSRCCTYKLDGKMLNIGYFFWMFLQNVRLYYIIYLLSEQTDTF